MNPERTLSTLLFGLVLLSSCTPKKEIVNTPTSVPPQVTEILPTGLVASALGTSAPEALIPVGTPSEILEPPSFNLAEPGPYFAGNRVHAYIDESRNGREIELLLWYPAMEQTDSDGHTIVRDSAPDISAAPYPLILTEEASGGSIFLSHLATHGFVLGVVRSPSSTPSMSQGEFALINLTRDFLFILDQIALNPPDGLEGVINPDRVGVTGFSYGGDISLALSGARIDPEFYISQCGQISAVEPESFQWLYADFVCPDAQRWEEFIAFVGDEMSSTDDGLWQPLADERILAVIPMAPSVSWYFGERGLAAADRPTLILTGTSDSLSPYQLETVYTYEHLGSSEKYLISFIGRTHGMAFSPLPVMQIRHFVTAFFGFFLQGHDDYSAYFSQDFVAQFDDLAWGVYRDE